MHSPVAGTRNSSTGPFTVGTIVGGPAAKRGIEDHEPGAAPVNTLSAAIWPEVLGEDLGPGESGVPDIEV
jgi:hypothetical protein